MQQCTRNAFIRRALDTRLYLQRINHLTDDTNEYLFTLSVSFGK